MHTMPLTFNRQVEESAVFLLDRQNPNDYGWGLNIEKGYQASSIVNTSEAIFVINRSGIEFETTSGWLLEEKGAALALGKSTLMLIEDGIDRNEIGGLQGDDQWLSFTRNNFASVVADAIEMLSK